MIDEDALKRGMRERQRRLIAAAPELLAACKATCASFVDPTWTRLHGDAPIYVRKAFAAILKAEGHD